MDVDQFVQKIHNREYVVGIIGLGYVGLPLLWTFHEAGMPVIGYDIDEFKVDCINKGIPYIKHLGDDKMKKLSSYDRCSATTDFRRHREDDDLLICVPHHLSEYE